MKVTKYLILVLMAGLFAVSCNNTNNENEKAGTTETELSGKVRIDGSSTVYPITEAMAEEFRTVAPKVKVTVGVSGTGGGFKKFSRGETDINDASRPIKEKEVVKCAENNVSHVELSVAYDGLAVMINPKNDWVDYFTVEELKMLWEPDAQNNIMRWNQIRSEWPNEEIHLFGPGVASGTFDYFTEAIVGESGASRGDFTASEDDNVLVQGIAGDKFSLGFFGLAYYEENKDKLNLVGVENGAGDVVLPTLQTVKDGTYEPLSRPLFIYVSKLGAKKPEVVEFVNFYLNNISEIVSEVGYIPLPETEYQKEREEFKAFISK